MHHSNIPLTLTISCCACSACPLSRVRHLSTSINGRHRCTSDQSRPPACRHCSPLSYTVRAAG